MNVFSKITLQSLKKNYTRTIVTVIGVILSVALITAVTDSPYLKPNKSIAQKPGR